VTRYFTRDYLERVTLRDGTPVELRLVRGEDEALLRDGFEQLSPESRYARFLSPKTRLTEHELRYLCDVDQEAHFALGAVHAETGIGLGIARFVALPDAPGVAEAAITVADHAQRKGLGKLLLLRLCAAAAERGIDRFRCDVLGSNTGMAALLAEIDPERAIEVAGGVMSIELVVPRIDPAEPVTSQPRGPIYRLLRAAAADAVEWTEAVRGLWRR
jgi:GNAT superfamily N-acetyltransferase